MTFKCCKNCIIDMICQTPCEKFEVEDLELINLSDFNKCLLLMKKYNNNYFKLDNEISVKIMIQSISFYKNGKRHRDDGPAIIRSNRYQAWYKNDQRHRDDGPAVIYADGNEAWYKNGQRHRDNGPAVKTDKYKLWYKNGVYIK